MTSASSSRGSKTSAADDTAPGPRLAAVAASGFLVLVAFQLAIVFGAPLGAAAWGGENAGQLPSDLRVASAFSSVFWSFAALTVLSRGRSAVSLVPFSVSRWGTWALVGILAIGTVMNLASSSAWERFGWAPLVFVLAIVCVKLARTDTLQPITAAGTSAPIDTAGIR
jgi:hypothetical protein